MMEKTNLLGAIVAVAFFLSAILVFVFRLLGKPQYGHWSGYFEFLLAVPLVILLIQAPQSGRPTLYYIQIGCMLIWQDAGIPPADILLNVTIVPAQFMGLGDPLGTISEGKTASMMLVPADPLKDISNAQQIESIFLRGQYFNREDLDRLLEEAKGLAQTATVP